MGKGAKAPARTTYRRIAWTLALTIVSGAILFEFFQDSVLSWMLPVLALLVLIAWWIAFFSTWIELLTRRFVNAMILGVAAFGLLGWMMLPPPVIGEKVIARHTMKNGTKLVWTQDYHGRTGHATYLYFRRPEESWKWIMVDHEDSRWFRGSIESEGNEATIWRWLPVASFSSKNGTLSMHGDGSRRGNHLSLPSELPAFLSD